MRLSSVQSVKLRKVANCFDRAYKCFAVQVLASPAIALIAAPYTPRTGRARQSMAPMRHAPQVSITARAPVRFLAMRAHCAGLAAMPISTLPPSANARPLALEYCAFPVALVQIVEDDAATSSRQAANP